MVYLSLRSSKVRRSRSFRPKVVSLQSIVSQDIILDNKLVRKHSVKVFKPLQEFESFSFKDFSVQSQINSGQIVNLFPTVLHASVDSSLNSLDGVFNTLDSIDSAVSSVDSVTSNNNN